jgi:ABC-type glycerol-3-phosphate transport system permease component
MSGEWFDDNYMQFYFPAILYSFIFSFPLLIVASVLFYMIRHAGLSVRSKFGSWMFFATVLPLITLFSLVSIFSEGEIYNEEIEMIIPSAIASFIAVLIRYKQFFKLFPESENESTIAKNQANDIN